MANDVLLNTTTDLNGKTLVTAEGDRSITGLLTYSRGASAPFAVGSGAASVANLDADKLDGQHAPAGTIVGTSDAQTLTNKILTGATLNSPTVAGATITGTPSIDVITLTGGQINFPATQAPSAGVNVLDDYEEGTWTPVIGGSGGTSGQTYTTQVGSYVKIGKLVFAQYFVQLLTKGTITTNVQIQGLPFTAENTANQFNLGAVRWANLATNWVNIIAFVSPNTTAADIMGATAAGTANVTNLATADLNNTAQFTGMIVYRATA